jgi:hypothetical protein
MMGRRWKFSLRTLLLFVLLIGAGGALYLRWEPWQPVLTLRPGGTFMKEARFSPDGRLIVTHSGQGDFPAHEKSLTVVWDRAGTELYRTDWCYDMGAGGYDGVKFVNNGRYVCISASHHMTYAQLLDTQSFAMLFPEDIGARCFPSFSRDEKRCAVYFNDIYGHNAWFAVYDLEKGVSILEEREFFDAKKDQRSVREIKISADGRWVAAFCDEEHLNKTITQHLLVHDLETKAKHAIPIDYADSVHFTADQKRIVLAGNSNVFVFDLPDMKRIFERADQGDVCADRYYSKGGLEWLALQNGEQTSIIDLQDPALRETVLEKSKRTNLQLSGCWLGWLTEPTKGVLRNVIDGREYPFRLNEDSSSFTADFYWGLSPFGEDLQITSGGEPQFFNTRTRTVSTQPRSRAYSFSPDQTRGFKFDEDYGVIFANPGEDERARIPATSRVFQLPEWSPDSQTLLKPHKDVAELWSRVRSDEPGALWWEPALWLAIFFGGGFVHSLWLGWRASRERGTA